MALIVQDLQKVLYVLYEILSKIFVEEIIELNVNTDMMIKNVKLLELDISFATVEYTNSKDD